MTISDNGVRRFGSTASVLPFVDALRRLCVSIDEEAELRTADVEVFRRSLLRYQTVLADAASALATSAQVRDVDLGRPVFIVGFLRTGTTLLQNLMSRHEDLYAPPLWELLSPVETSTGSKAVHTRLQTMTRAYVEDYYRRAPQIRDIHVVDVDAPDECHRMLAATFHSMIYELAYRVPSYGEWLARQDLTGAYQWHRRLLGLIMSVHRRPDGGLLTPLLKCPFHTWFLGDLARVYPQARLIHLHRDPVEVVASTASLSRALRRSYSDHVDSLEVGAVWGSRVISASANLAAWRDDMVDRESVLDVLYPELVADPMAVTARICAFLEIPASPRFAAEVMGYLAAQARTPRNRHAYSCQEFGWSESAITTATQDYRRRFGF